MMNVQKVLAQSNGGRGRGAPPPRAQSLCHEGHAAFSNAKAKKGTAAGDKFLKEAVELYSQSFQLHPHHMPLVYRAKALFQLGRYRECIKDCDLSLDMAYNEGNTEFALAYRWRGNAYKELGQWQKACDDFHEFVRLKPEMRKKVAS